MVMPGRHWSHGFKCTIVSVMFKAAGSVAVSARATFATTDATWDQIMATVYEGDMVLHKVMLMAKGKQDENDAQG